MSGRLVVAEWHRTVARYCVPLAVLGCLGPLAARQSPGVPPRCGQALYTRAGVFVTAVRVPGVPEVVGHRRRDLQHVGAGEHEGGFIGVLDIQVERLDFGGHDHGTLDLGAVRVCVQGADLGPGIAIGDHYPVEAVPVILDDHVQFHRLVVSRDEEGPTGWRLRVVDLVVCPSLGVLGECLAGLERSDSVLDLGLLEVPYLVVHPGPIVPHVDRQRLVEWNGRGLLGPSVARHRDSQDSDYQR
jgi:hypothetical protein